MITLLGLAAVLMALVVGVLRVVQELRAQRRLPAGYPDGERLEARAVYRRYLSASANAGGSRHSWDHQVRPVLADLAVGIFAARSGSAGEVATLGRTHLGESLWQLVDPGAHRCPDRRTLGPTRETLVEILLILEQLE